MKKLLFILLFLSVASFSFAGNADFVKTYSGHGTVTFDHSKHNHYETDCDYCHTPLKANGVDKKFGHAVCRDCHKKSQEKTAPTKCSGCHIK